MIDQDKLKTTLELIEQLAEEKEINCSFTINYDLPSADWACYDLYCPLYDIHFCDIDHMIITLKELIND